MLSGGMDGRLCLWGHNKRSGETLTGHDMSITRVIPIHPYNIAITCGYDKKACIYKFPSSDPTSISMSTSTSSGRSGEGNGVGRALSTRQSAYTTSFSTSLKPYEYLIGHTEPILECIVLGPSSSTTTSTTSSTTTSTTSASDLRVVTGDRNNILKLWDLATGDMISTYDNNSSSGGGRRGNSGGSSSKPGTMITCLYSYYTSFTTPNYHTKGQNYDHHRPTQFISGAMDGCIRIYDTRQDQCVASIPAHCSTIDQTTTSLTRSANTTTATTSTAKAATRPLSGMKSNEDIYTSNLGQQSSLKPPHRGRNETGLRPSSTNPSYPSGDGGIGDLADMYHQLSLPSSSTTPVTTADAHKSSSAVSSTLRKSLRPSRLLQSTTSRPVSSSTPAVPPTMTGIATSRATSYTASATSTAAPVLNCTMKGHPVTCLSGLPDDPDGHYLLSGGADGRLLFIDLRWLSSSYVSGADGSRGGCIVAEYAQHKQGVHSMSVVSNDCVYTGDGAGQCHLCNMYSVRISCCI